MGERIRGLRARIGLTQSGLAAVAGMSTSYISRIEAGQRAPGKEALARLSRALQVTPAELLGKAAADPVVIEMELERAQADLESGHPLRALRSMNVLLSRYADSLGWESRCKALLIRGAARYRAGDRDGGLAELDEMLTGKIPRDVLYSLLQTMSALYLEAGDLARAIDLAREGLDEVNSAEPLRGDNFAALGATLASAYRERGDLASAQAVGRRVLGVTEQVGSPQARGEAYRTASLNAEASGDRQRALLLASRALGAFSEGESRLQLARMRLAYARILLSVSPEHAAEAIQLLAAAEPVLRISASAEAAQCRLQLARASLAAGDLDRAIEIAHAAAGEMAGLQAAQAQLIVAQAQILAGRRASAQEALRVARDSLGTVPPSRPAAQAWRELGDLCAKTDSSAAAIAAYGRALLMVGLPPLSDGTGPDQPDDSLGARE